MKEETRKRLSKLILEELSEKIKVNESLGRKLESFVDLPVEKVADAIIKQFEYLLSSDLRELIIYLIEQEAKTEQSVTASEAEQSTEVDSEVPPPLPVLPVEKAVTTELPAETANEPVDEPQEEVISDSIMRFFGSKEIFPTEPIDFQLLEDDWFYLYGFCYSPDSTGKGIPSTKLKMKGVDGTNNIFLLDYGDVRFFLSKLNLSDYTLNKAGEPVLPSREMRKTRLVFSSILNTLRAQEIIVPLPFWTVMCGRERIIRLIEDRYVELLRGLIDVHDAVEWDVEVFVLDAHILNLPAVKEITTDRIPQREAKHLLGKKIDVKLMEKVIFREKNIAQGIHSQLLKYAFKVKIDFIIRLDSAFIDDWKPVLSARYQVGKENRKSFCQAVAKIEDDYKEYELMINVSSPHLKFSFN